MSSEKDLTVQVKALTKHHGNTLAVDGLSFDVRKNEFFSILGPSGSGKSTTLRLIAGLIQADEGDIVVNGQSMNGRPPHQRPVNTVFQDYALFPHMTVWSNIAFGLQMQGVTRSEVVKRVGGVLDIVKLPDKGDRLPSELSGGEQQRVALARALVNRPAVILLDEPLGALDQQLRQEMQRELKLIQAQVGITFICVTHHQAEALFMSDRVAVMKEGRLMQIGEPEDLYAQPRSLFVAEFVGRSNRLEGTVESSHDTHSVFQSSGLNRMRIPQASQNLVGNNTVMILRPEQLTLSRENECGPDENCLESEVNQAFYFGDAMQYVITVAPQVEWIVQGAAQHDRAARFHPGEKAFVRWEAQHGLLFPQ